jgi:hypothetical protein
MPRRDEIERVHKSLADAFEILAAAGEPVARLANARAKVVWMTRENMPVEGAIVAFTMVQDVLMRLEGRPPVKGADLAELRWAIDQLLDVIEGHLGLGLAEL